MRVNRHGDRYHVRVEELLPCARFNCTHESMSCAIKVWCPDGCFDSNTYYGACIPKCHDCIHYPDQCDEWPNYPDKNEHSALNNTQ